MQHAMVCARTWSAREAEIRLEPGSEEAWPAAQVAYRYASLHAVFFACYAILFAMLRPHAMQPA